MSSSLPLVWKPLLDQEHFQVGQSNQEAFQWIQTWPWPWNIVCFYGPPGCGKTHLGAIWVKKHQQCGQKVIVLDPQSPLAVTEAKAYLLDGMEDFFQRSEQEVLSFWNDLWSHKAHCLLLSRCPPSQWPFQLNDLLSRVRSVMTVAISAPDDLLLQKVLEKSLADKGFRPSSFILKYILTRMPRSFEAVREITTEILKAQEKGVFTFSHLKLILSSLYDGVSL